MTDDMIGIKESELRALGDCAVCGKKLGAGGHPLFLRVTVETCGVMMDAIKRQDGLAQMLGGNSYLASVMGPDADLAKVVMRTKPVLVHVGCRDNEMMLTLVQAAGGNVLAKAEATEDPTP